jgi:hypothetical protein
MTQDKPEYKGIVKRLRDLQARIALLESAKGLLMTTGLAVVLFWLLVAVTLVTWPGTTARIMIDLFLVLVIAVVFYLISLRPILLRKGFLQIARLLEKHYGKFQARLIGALELYDKAVDNRENYSVDLIEKTIEEAGGIIAEIDTGVIVDKKPLISASIKTGLVAAVTAVGFMLYPSSLQQAWSLYSRPGAVIVRPPEFSLRLEPSGGEFFRNQDLTVRAIADGKQPRRTDLYFRFEDGQWASEPMENPETDSSDAFVYTFKNIKRTVELYARSGDIESGHARIDIVDPPRLVDLSLTVDPPDYTGLPNVTGDPNDGNVAALKGSLVKIEANANKPLSAAFQLLGDSSKAGLKVEGDRVSGRFKIVENGKYTIMLSDLAGRVNPEPIWYDIQVLEDYPPSIEILFPAMDVDLGEQMVLPLEMSISDDYGFDGLNLVWWMISEGQQTEPSKEAISIPDAKAASQLIDYNWDINRIAPLPGDLIYYYCEVSDNDIISGPKWARSHTFLARLPSLDEILAEVQGSQEQQISELEEALKDQQQLQREIKEVAREMMKAVEVDWEKQQAARNILEKQKDIAEKMQNIADEMEENFDQLQDNMLIGEQIAEKMQEIQNLLDEVATPELKEAMKKLQEALENMDPEQLRQALEDFQMSSEELLESLDRSLDLLKRLAVEQKMDLLVELAQRILDEQNRINENVEKAADSSALASQSQACKNNSGQFNSLKEQFEQLKKMDEEMKLVPEKEKSEADSQINNPRIPENFDDLKSALSMGQGGKCQKKGQNLSQDLENVLAALKAARDAMQQQMMAEILGKLQRATEDLLYLSNRQEVLLDTTVHYENTAEDLPRLVDDQSELETAAEKVADQISEASKKTIFINMSLMRLMGQTLNNLSEACTHLGNRSAQKAAESETSAMANMNKAVDALMQTSQACKSSCSGSGMKETMNKMGGMCQKQSGINQQTMMLMPKPGIPMSLGQQQSLQQLAAQQEALRNQLQELNDELGSRGQILGRLDALGEEMKKVADDLARSKVDRRTIERQQRILSRMLDAQRSVNRREYSRKRKAEQGVDVVRRGPDYPDENRPGNGWLSDIIEQALKERYPREYEQLIKAYFKSLQSEGASLEP